MEIFFSILLALFGLSLVGFGAYYAHQWSTSSGVAILAIGLLVLLLDVPYISWCVNTKIKVDTLLESGKYEIVTNEDYSLKELEQQFMKVGCVYLKEVEE